MALFYHVCTGAFAGAVRLLASYHVEGRQHLPKGPVIVVSNHLSFLDPPLLGASLHRQMVFLAKRELFHGLGGWCVRTYGAIEVRRGEFDRKGLEEAEAVLGRGLALGVFPEGRRHPQGGMGRAQPGAVLLACRTGVPVLPVGIIGTERVQKLKDVFSRPTIRVAVGEPIQIPSSQEAISKTYLAHWHQQVMSAVAGLLPEPYQGAYRAAGARALALGE
ncbi:MAG: 1-acyl-sn-glycerol-3-phosphate acyltransferase [Chloroflexi bacterium]|nr:1-acyl-sn-glycerol-3-phosphate acyltransferase [Chloroflexota bacterium]